MIKVIGPKDLKKYKSYINVTSSGDEFKSLSPFYLGPCPLYNGYLSRNMENAWQFSKVYKQHVDKWGNPSKEYFDWAQKGWADFWAQRYPMGKNKKPEYSYWNGEKLGYLEAREKIYIPLYKFCARQTEVFNDLADMVRAGKEVILFDYDGYSDYDSLEEVKNNPKRKMGHAFVLAMMLEELKQDG